ncbi:hypothetical protein ASG80_12045 [Agromyces sp. Soil535]|nr:hypothetical protein ASG80_12045 [Agromyces sp. Soil535]
MASAAAGAGIAVLLLSGCVGSPVPTATPTASETAEPIFASDEEALAAAEAAYREYSAALNSIAREDNRNPERITAVVSGTYAEQVEALFNDLTQRGLSIEGESTVDSFRLIEAVEVDRRAEVTILLCSDVGLSKIVDAAGNDVTPPDRPDRSALLAVIVSAENDPTDLVVQKEEPWSGEYC